MAFNNNFTDELRQRLSIVDIVGRRVPLAKKGQNYWGCCPFHNEKTPSFSVNEEKGFFHCFGCGEHGDIISFVMKTNNVDFKTAIADLAAQAGLKLPDYKPKSADQIKREENYVGIYDAAAKIYAQKLYEPGGAHALEYLRKRGFDDATIKKYCIGYAPKSNTIANRFADTKFEILSSTGLVRRGDYGNYDFFRDRLMFSIFSASGQIIAFSGRSLDGSEPKYINTGETELFHKGRVVFGLNFARDAIHKANRAIVVEGQIDAIKMQISGFPETVAPLGTALTADHIGILCKLNRNIVFCFDGDTAGQKAAGRALDIIAEFIRDNSDVRFAFMPAGKDPDDILGDSGLGTGDLSGYEKMKSIINNAVSLIDFLWNFMNKNFNTATPGGKTTAEKWSVKWLEKISDIKLREMMRAEIGNLIWQNWKKIKSKKELDSAAAAAMPVPEIDAITQKTLSAIIDAYPELAERYGEFLASLNIELQSSSPQSPIPSPDMAEKFIVSLKLKKYLEKLELEKRELTAKLLSGDETAKATLECTQREIEKSTARLEQIISGL